MARAQWLSGVGWVWSALLLLLGLPVHGNHDAKRLYDNLLKRQGYNQLIRPVANHSDTLTVKLGLKLSQVSRVDEKNEIISLNMWLLQEWTDHNLQWNPAEYGGVEMIYVPSTDIWLPDIVLYNNADGDYTVTLRTKATLTHTGRVHWSPPVIFKSQCDIDVQYFPFDEQKCKLKLGSWTYDGSKVDLRHKATDPARHHPEVVILDAIQLDDYYSSVEWDLIDTSAKKNILAYPCCPRETYPDVTFHMTLRRRTLYYTVNLIVPCVAICMLTMVAFYVPSECHEKISISISILLSLTLFQLLLMDLIPATSVHVPMIGKYLLLTSIMVTMSVCFSVIVLNKNHRCSVTHEMPALTRWLFLEKLPKLLLMQGPESTSPEEVDQLNPEIFLAHPVHSDLANYENLYKSKLASLSGSLDDVSKSNSFVGFDSPHCDLDNSCKECPRYRNPSFPPHALKGFEGINFIGRHLSEDDKRKRDEKNEIITLNMWLLQEWKDHSLQWDPEEYGGVKMLFVPSTDIWLPDIVLYNNADGDYQVTLMTKAILTYSGDVTWNPPVIFKSQCDINVLYFPFDEQVCKLKLGSWTYDGTKVDLRHRKKRAHDDEVVTIVFAIDLNEYYPSVEWDLLDTRARKNIKYYPCCLTEPYPDVTFNLTLRRKTLYYTINLIVPCVAINMLTILAFYLPAEAGEKISITISIVLSLSLFQLLLMELVPGTSVHIPLLGKHLMFTTVLVTVSVFMSVVVLNLHHRRDSSHTRVPALFRWLFIKVLPRFLFLKKFEEEEDVDSGIDDESFTGGHGDMQNYGNPYKKEMVSLSESMDDLDVQSSFLGFKPSNNYDLSNFCDACANKRWAQKIPNNVNRALEGAGFIAKRLKKDDDTTKVVSEWRYVAFVIDRILLYVYITVCIVGATGLLLNAPVLYDQREALVNNTGHESTFEQPSTFKKPSH